MSELEIAPVLDYLRQERIILDHHVQEIMAEKIPYYRTMVLIMMLKRRGPRTFKTFVEALKRSEQMSLAKILEDE